jgi:hypothetical protein
VNEETFLAEFVADFFDRAIVKRSFRELALDTEFAIPFV